MWMRWLGLAAALALGGCAGHVENARNNANIADITIIAFNDFHGNIVPPGLTVDDPQTDGSVVKVPAGGAAHFAAAVQALKKANPNNVVVAAGDLVGASPIASALFLDEPTILAMNLIGLEFNAVGNHEFDRGQPELFRLRDGGCEKYTALQPCRLDPDFPGSRFPFLSANVVRKDNGETLFPATGLKEFVTPAGKVRVAFIGMTLKDAPAVSSPAGIAGLDFRDEADSANALIPKLKAEGADAIILVIHQGGETDGAYDDKSCPGLTGEILPILERLDPAVDVVVSGHTHQAYVCDYGRINPAKPFLLTSAGRYSTLVTDIRLTIDPAASRVTAKSADNVIVRAEAGASDPQVAALVDRYAAEAKPLAARVVGRMAATATRDKTVSGEHVLGDLIADAQLAATRAPGNGGAQIAFMNPGGVRADLVPGPGGEITYGQLFATQPFSNSMTVKSFTGRQIRAILEQQWNSGSNSPEQPRVLLVSSTFRYAYDLSKPAGQRILEVTVDGAPLQDDKVYRVAMNSFLAIGGDNFTALRDGADVVGGISDIDALEAYVAAAGTLRPPVADRITNRTPG